MILIKARVNREKHCIEIQKPITNQWVGVRYYQGKCDMPSFPIRMEVSVTVGMRLGSDDFMLDWVE